MFRKCLLTAALSLTLLTGFARPEDVAPVAAPAQEQTLPDGQEKMIVSEVPSAEVDYVEESPVARKMTQAEKAQNAAENDSWGGAITIIAMSIVLAALIILSLLFLGFGKISSFILTRKKMKAKGVTPDDAEDHHKDLDSGEVIAAIGMALAEHFDSTHHDREDTILTIRRMKRAYSPWNSKIYNMRPVPAINHQPAAKKG